METKKIYGKEIFLFIFTRIYKKKPIQEMIIVGRGVGIKSRICQQVYRINYIFSENIHSKREGTHL